MTNDLGNFMLVTMCLFGGIAALLSILAALEPPADRTGVAHRGDQRPS